MIILSILFTVTTLSSLYDFTNSSASDWKVVDDVVMGGRSSGNFTTNEANNGVFYGVVSLENNGGFSSVRMRLETTNTEKYNGFKVRLKGDRKRYQFRIKSDRSNYFSYICYFETTGDWQEVEIPFEEMYPSFRGRKLSQPNFDGSQVEEITFLIANKEAQEFRLEMDWIKLQ